MGAIVAGEICSGKGLLQPTMPTLPAAGLSEVLRATDDFTMYCQCNIEISQGGIASVQPVKGHLPSPRLLLASQELGAEILSIFPNATLPTAQRVLCFST